MNDSAGAAAPDVLKLHAESQGDAPAVIVDPSNGARPGITTFAELNATVNRLAHGLRALGIEQGDRIVWCGPNSLEVITVVHAARKSGLVAVPLSYRFNADEMQYVIDNSDATLVVADADYAPLIAEVRDRLPNVKAFVGFVATAETKTLPGGFHAWHDVIAGQPTDEPVAPAASSVGAQMLYTSGTTGKPKGALRTRTNSEIVFALLAELGLQFGNEVHITTGPMYHSGPLAFAAIAHSMGGLIVAMRRFDPVAWLAAVKEHRATNTFSAPTQLKRIVSLPDAELAKADMSSMRCLIANAAPVPYALKQEVVEKLGDGFLYEVYGSTEMGIITVLKPQDQLRKPGSCGTPYGGIEFRIMGEDGKVAKVGERGELFMSTGLAMDGYHRTQEQLHEIEDGAWKSVGDVAYVDDEGYLHICDRIKDMIISGGVNIYPAEIEAVIYGHPQILDAAVFGVPDDEWGESVYCIVQPKEGETLDLEELRAFTEARVGGYKRPRAYEVRDELPRTDAGKLLKRVLRDEFWKDRTSAV
jgi:acyl-CoA synthetase (AMP-forming)/AMP-acid ligase II